MTVARPLPYKLYWVESAAKKAAVAKLCLEQAPAETASALVAVVAGMRIDACNPTSPIAMDAQQQLR